MNTFKKISGLILLSVGVLLVLVSALVLWASNLTDFDIIFTLILLAMGLLLGIPGLTLYRAAKKNDVKKDPKQTSVNLLTTMRRARYKNQQPTDDSPVETGSSFGRFMIFAIISLIATLPFHYVPSRLMVFPKSDLTFSYTVITENDINFLIKQYNNASFLEKQILNSDPVVRKLLEHGIIVEK